MRALLYDYMDTPVGRLLLAGDGETLHFVAFQQGSRAFGPRIGWQPCPAAVSEAKAQLDAYFAGVRRAFDLCLSLGGTAFQRSVWEALRGLPYGETRSYGWLAHRLGRPAASRAVGAANGANPLPIVLPCHRLVGSDGRLRGFGGGLAAKRHLIALERANAPAADRAVD